MAIDSLFERGTRPDWEEFVSAMRKDRQIAKDTLYMCEHHQNIESTNLARVLVNYFYKNDTDMGLR